VYHATTHVLSGAGATGRPQNGHSMEAVAKSASDISDYCATIVPPRTPPFGLRGSIVLVWLRNSHGRCEGWRP